jgi:hypothetical protein
MQLNCAFSQTQHFQIHNHGQHAKHCHGGMLHALLVRSGRSCAKRSCIGAHEAEHVHIPVNLQGCTTSGDKRAAALQIPHQFEDVSGAHLPLLHRATRPLRNACARLGTHGAALVPRRFALKDSEREAIECLTSCQTSKRSCRCPPCKACCAQCLPCCCCTCARCALHNLEGRGVLQCYNAIMHLRLQGPNRKKR